MTGEIGWCVTLTRKMEKVEEVKELTLGLIKELDVAQLVTVAESLSLTIKEEKKSKKEAMRNLVIRHLTSEDIEDSADEGLDLYKKVAETVTGILEAAYEDRTKLQELKEQSAGGSKMSKLEMKLKDEVEGLEDEESESVAEQLKELSGDALLDTLLNLKLEALTGRGGKRKAVSGKVAKKQTGDVLGKLLTSKLETLLRAREKGEDEDEEEVESDDEVESRRVETSRKGEKRELSRMKLKDFKIEGGIIGGEKNSLDYCSLRFQMEEGLHQGYTKKEVRTGVIKAIKAGTTTRRYFERNAHTITHKEFLKTLRELYDNSDTDDLVDDMCERVQAKGESEREYFMAMFELQGQHQGSYENR